MIKDSDKQQHQELNLQDKNQNPFKEPLTGQDTYTSTIVENELQISSPKLPSKLINSHHSTGCCTNWSIIPASAIFTKWKDKMKFNFFTLAAQICSNMKVKTKNIKTNRKGITMQPRGMLKSAWWWHLHQQVLM